MIRVLIVAAYASVRAGLHALLTDAEDCALVGEVSDNTELQRLLPDLRPDVVLYDYNREEAGRILETVAQSEASLVMLGDTRTDYALLAQSPLHGWAYLRKEADGAEIAGAIRAVAAGLIALDRSLASLLTPALTFNPDRLALEDLPDAALTAREREVLQLMAQGLPNKQIAARLSISLHTVKFHVASILSKLEASSRTEAVTQGARRGLISL